VPALPVGNAFTAEIERVDEEQEIRLLAAAQDQDPQKAAAFVKANNYKFPVLLDPQGKAGRLYGVTAYPTTYLIDKKGRIRAREVGSSDWSARSVVDQIIKLTEEK